MRDIAVVGSGYVGTVVAACFASLGHSVIAVEKDPERLQNLQAGNPGFEEDGLAELLGRGLESGALVFDDIEAASRCGIVFLCLGTPSRPDGHLDVEDVRNVASEIARLATRPIILVTKSTVPVGTADRIKRDLEEVVASLESSVGPPAVISNPEFLREGNAIEDFLHPARVVLGGDDDGAVAAIADLYKPILEQSFPGGDVSAPPALLTTSSATAEMVKYASNAFLATKISFINQIAELADRLDSDVTVVADAMGMDPRIGRSFLDAGVGWGGSCFGKDLRGLIALARDNDVPASMLEATDEINRHQRDAVVDHLDRHLHGVSNRQIGLLGLAFKPGTSDTRDAPSVGVARRLQARGARVVGYDPIVKQMDEVPDLEFAPDLYSVAEGSEAVVILTDWPEFKRVDYDTLSRLMQGTLVIDGRNMLDPAAVRSAGLHYVGIGRR